MDQKQLNQRIAMSLLRQCAWMWEHCTSMVQNEGEFSFSDVWQGMGQGAHKSKPGYVLLEPILCKYWDVFNKTQPIDGLTFDEDTMTSHMEFRTDEYNPDCVYRFSFPIASVFEVTRDFCQMNGCPGLLSKTLFYNKGGEKSALLPKIQEKAVKPRGKAKPKAKPKAAAPVSMEDRLRAALKERFCLAA